MTRTAVLALGSLPLVGCASPIACGVTTSPPVGASRSGPCFELDPGDIYVGAALCLDAPTPGRFTLGERQAVPDASRECQGRWREPGQIVLQVQACDHRSVDQQRGKQHQRRQLTSQTLQATICSPHELVVQATWGQQVVVRR